MNGSLKVVHAIVLLSFVGLFFTSCGGNQTTLGSTGSTSGTTTGGNTGQSSGTQSIEEEEENATIPAGYSASNLFVTVPDTISYVNYSAIHNSWADRCSFTSSSLVNDLTCTVQVGELALFHEGLKLQYNVPANQCSYIGTQPYWYYNSEIGIGPTDVIVNVNKDASGTITSTTCSVDGSVLASCSTVTPPTASWRDVEFDIADDIKVKCAYDSSDEDGGVNCCFGKYRLRTNVSTPDGITSTDERGKTWGGSMASCIGGAGKTDWENKNKDGVPVYLIEKMEPGVARTKIIKTRGALETLGYANNIPVANYYTEGLHTHTGYGAASGTVYSNYPYFVDPISDRSGSLIPIASPHYQFDCMDEAFEVNYRIRVMVQEWDTMAALSSFIANGTSGTPVYGADSGEADDPGTAPTACPGISGEACNQSTDSDDFVRDLTGYDTMVPAKRKGFFPRDTYQ